MRKQKNTFRVTLVAAPLALALGAPFAAKADLMETYWAAPPNQSAWVNSVGECWQGADGEANLPPCGAAPAPLVLNLLFELDKYRLENIRNPEALQKLDDYIAEVKTTNREEKLTVTGETDKLGTWEHNLILSENRANTIRDYMVDHGVPSQDIVSVKGVAWDAPPEIGPDGQVVDLGPLENNPLRRRAVVNEVQ